MKNRVWIAIFAAALILLAAAALVLSRQSAGTVAVVYQDGARLRAIDLSKVVSPYSFTVRDGDGHENVVEVEPGRIRVASANCPDQVCVRTGWLSSGRRPIVCLPARLTIRLESGAADDGIDSIAG